MTATTLIKRLPHIPKPGEVILSVNLGRVEKVDHFLALASAYGYEPELRFIRFKDATEIHALLVHVKGDPHTLDREAYRPYLDQLEEWGIDYSAIRFVCGYPLTALPAS